MKTLTLNINGMHCGGCLSKVEKALKNVQGVQSASISLQEGQAAVTFDSASVGVSDLVQAVVDAGYTASVDKQPVALQTNGGCGSNSGKGKGGCGCS